MTLDFITDLLEKLKKQGFQYHLVVFDSDGKGGGNLHTFDNIEVQDSLPMLEALGESIQNLGAQYEDFIKHIQREMRKEEKKKKIKGPSRPPV